MENTGMWNAILKWSLKQNDGTKPSQLRPLSQEDKVFLEQVFKSIAVDPVARMKVLVATIQIPDDAPFEAWQKIQQQQEAEQKQANANSQIPETETKDSNAQNLSTKDLERLVVQKKEAALDELDDHVAQIDFATDLHKIGGLVPLIQTLHSKHPSLQARAAQVLATTVQNNPQVQEWALKHRALKNLMDLLENCRDSTVLSKVLLAISSLIRNNQKAETMFLDANGLRVLLQVLINPQEEVKLRVKALSLLRHLWHHKNLCKPSKIPHVVATLVDLAGHPDPTLRENALHGLHQLLENCPANSSECAGLEQKLRKQLKRLEALVSDEQDDAQDEMNLLKQLLEMLPATH